MTLFRARLVSLDPKHILLSLGVLASVLGIALGRTILLEIGIPGTLGLTAGSFLAKRPNTEMLKRDSADKPKVWKLELIALVSLFATELFTFHTFGFGSNLLLASSATWMVLFGMVLGGERKHGTVLTAVILQSLFSRAFVFYSLNSLVGIDPWFHLNAAAGIIQAGYVVTPGLYAFY